MGEEFAEPEECPYQHPRMMLPPSPTEPDEQGEELVFGEPPPSSHLPSNLVMGAVPVFSEDGVITYDRVFELERKKRQLLNAGDQQARNNENAATTTLNEAGMPK